MSLQDCERGRTLGGEAKVALPVILKCVLDDTSGGWCDCAKGVNVGHNVVSALLLFDSCNLKLLRCQLLNILSISRRCETKNQLTRLAFI